MKEIQIPSLGQEDPLEEEIATHSSILGWEIPWTEEPGGLQSSEPVKLLSHVQLFAIPWTVAQGSTQVSHIAADTLPSELPGKPKVSKSQTRLTEHTHTHLLKRSDISLLQVSDQNGEFRWHQPHGLVWQTGALKRQRSFMVEKSAPEGWGNFSISILLENKQTNKFLIVL